VIEKFVDAKMKSRHT